MKILYITNGYKPHRWAGTETYTAGLAEEMAGRGHDVQVLCAGEWEKGAKYWNGVSEDLQNGIRVRRINLNWAKSPDPFRYLYDNPVVAQYLATLLQEESFDLVHVTSCETLSASVFQVIKTASIPLVFTLTDFWMLCPRISLLKGNGSNCSGQTTPDECLSCMMTASRLYQSATRVLPDKYWLPLLRLISKYPFLTRRRGLRGLAGNMAHRKTMLKRALALPDHRITASSFVKNLFVASGVEVPIAVNPYGHDLGWLRSYSGKARSDALRLGYIGQIFHAKGLHVLLQAMSHVPKDYLDRFSLIIYGNLSSAGAYGQQVKELASILPNVIFGGTYQHAQSGDVFSKIDVLVVPSLWFDFPLIIYEAFATGTPVIATNLGGMAEAVSHDVNGLLFNRGDSEGLARNIQRLLDESELLEDLRDGIPTVKAVSKEADTLEGKYLELVSRS